MTANSATHAIFDLDGTLLDTEDLYTLASQRVADRFGKTYTWEIKKRSMGGDARRSAQLAIDALQLPLTVEAYLEEREGYLLELIPGMAEIPGATSLLHALHARGVPMALATSSHKALCDTKLAGRAFSRVFSAVVCGDDPRLQRSKPAPDIFLLAARELGADPAACVAFEDSVNGVNAALAAGMRVVAVRNPRLQLDASDFAGAHRIVQDLTEVGAADFF